MMTVLCAQRGEGKGLLIERSGIGSLRLMGIITIQDQEDELN